MNMQIQANVPPITLTISANRQDMQELASALNHARHANERRHGGGLNARAVEIAEQVYRQIWQAIG